MRGSKQLKCCSFPWT